MFNKKEKLIIKIAIGVLLAIAIGLGIVVLLYKINGWEENYFIKHFIFAIILIMISGIAFLLPMLNQSRFSGDGKGDSLMLLVGILLFLTAILGIILSYTIQ